MIDLAPHRSDIKAFAQRWKVREVALALVWRAVQGDVPRVIEALAPELAPPTE